VVLDPVCVKVACSWTRDVVLEANQRKNETWPEREAPDTRLGPWIVGSMKDRPAGKSGRLRFVSGPAGEDVRPRPSFVCER